MNISLAPMLSVRRGSEAIDFYKEAFGAVVLSRIGEGSEPVVAHLSVEGAEFWVADESPEHANYSPESLNGSTCRFVLVVQEPAQAFARALAAGAREVWPVAKQHGWLVGRVVDPFGHHWEIGKQLERA